MTFDALARPSGTFLMVAMDQQESLRTMLAQHHPEPIDDARMVRFKLAVARELAPYASGFLIDRHYGFEDVVAQGLVPPSCGLLLAADALEQPPGGIVEDTDLDEGVNAAAPGIVALKLRSSRRRASFRPSVPISTSAKSRCKAAAIRPRSSGARARSMRSSRSRGSCSREASTPDDFPGAVAAACRGGASGMLAGRALWTSRGLEHLVCPEERGRLLRQAAHGLVPAEVERGDRLVPAEPEVGVPRRDRKAGPLADDRVVGRLLQLGDEQSRPDRMRDAGGNEEHVTRADRDVVERVEQRVGVLPLDPAAVRRGVDAVAQPDPHLACGCARAEHDPRLGLAELRVEVPPRKSRSGWA